MGDYLLGVEELPHMKSKLFTKQAALVTFGATDELSDGYAVVDHPRIVAYGNVQFIEATHAQESHDYIRGKRVLIPLLSVTSITEFDATAEAYAHDRRKTRRRRG